VAQRPHRHCDERSQVYERGAVVTRGAAIEWVGPEQELPAGMRPERTIELAGRWLTPGLVDCHTHLVFAGQRSAESRGARRARAMRTSPARAAGS